MILDDLEYVGIKEQQSLKSQFKVIMSLMTEQFPKEIIKRPRLPNNFLRNRTEENTFFL